MNRYKPIRQAAPRARVVNPGYLPALADTLLWSLACASCFGVGYCLALALARHLY